MSSNHDSKHFKALLNKLQQESWQLELIISGFAIFGLFSAYPEINVARIIASEENQIYRYVLLSLAKIACSILLFNLIIHVVLRGLWIGALGLRYVSGDIDFDTLNYHERFDKHLRKRIVSFDKYVANLENYCSIMFASSFLLIFYVLSLVLVGLSFVGIAFFLMSNEQLPEVPRITIGVLLFIFLSIGSILVFIDFITQGYLKKKRVLSKIYFPFYSVFKYLTLSFLYRPLVYNFLDNKFTKRLSFLLVPMYLVILIINTAKYQNSNYLDKVEKHSSLYLDYKKYEDQLLKRTDFVQKASIQSKVISSPYLKLFKPYNKNFEERIYKYAPHLKPKEDARGLKTKFQMNNRVFLSRKKRDSIVQKLITVVNEMHTVKIDSVSYPVEFLMSRNKQHQMGMESIIPIKSLSEGKHVLQLIRKRKRKNDTIHLIDTKIPFWYYPN
ncbi:conserved membrane hypothetical protein [Tenacibaculum litopenaei]|uniref:hypothetical protein n=1 Tax=Tenacibaculum litopenaei TaxID=396016 RepID=UPI0038954A85